jgi:hypothetical protein
MHRYFRGAHLRNPGGAPKADLSKAAFGLKNNGVLGRTGRALSKLV